MWIVTIVLLGLAALGLSGEVQQRSQRKQSRRETLLSVDEKDDVEPNHEDISHARDEGTARE